MHPSSAPEAFSAIEPRSVLPSQTRVSTTSGTPGCAAIHCCNRDSKPSTSSWLSSQRKVESDGDLAMWVPSSALRVLRCRLANRSIPSKQPWPLRIARIASSNIHQCGKRIPRPHAAVRQRLEEADQVSGCSSAPAHQTVTRAHRASTGGSGAVYRLREQLLLGAPRLRPGSPSRSSTAGR